MSAPPSRRFSTMALCAPWRSEAPTIATDRGASNGSSPPRRSSATAELNLKDGGRMKHWTRPDGRCFVFGEADDDLPTGRLYASAHEADEERLRSLTRLGFTGPRRELVLEIPTDPARWNVGAIE